MGLRLRKLGWAIYDHWWELILVALTICVVVYGSYRFFAALYYTMSFDR